MVLLIHTSPKEEPEIDAIAGALWHLFARQVWRPHGCTGDAAGVEQLALSRSMTTRTCDRRDCKRHGLMAFAAQEVIPLLLTLRGGDSAHNNVRRSIDQGGCPLRSL